MLTQEEIEHIADLARLHLEPEEMERCRQQIGSILEYVAVLQSVDTTGVAELSHPIGLENVWREDTLESCPVDERVRVLNAFPHRSGDLLEVPAVFEERTE